jgi:6-phosphogluconolactonase
MELNNKNMKIMLKRMNPLVLVVFTVIILHSCRTGTGDKAENTYTAGPGSSGFSFYVGTYTGQVSRGIYKYRMHTDGTLEFSGLAAETENPSYLALSPGGEFLLAVNENSPSGTVTSFRIENDSLVPLSRQPSGGEHPCYVSISEAGYVLTANYSSGSVGLLKIDSRGELSEILDIQHHKGKGSTDRQKGPHAHSVYFEPGTSRIISADLGTNEIWFSVLDTLQSRLLPSKQENLSMARGAGPRHIAIHPDGKNIYVINELNSTVTLLEKNASGEFVRGPSFTTLPAGYEGPNYCADIHISPDGRFVYASNRGHNSIAIFRVEPVRGALELSGHISSCGEWPRNFTLSPGGDYLLVANQHSDNIVSFKRDISTGFLEAVDTAEVPSPVCIAFRQKGTDAAARHSF